MIRRRQTKKAATSRARFSLLRLRAFLLALTSLMLCACPSMSATEQALRFYVDSPARSLWQDPTLTVGGWIWGGFDDPIQRVALESGDWSEDAAYGVERGDVAIALGIPAAAHAGFSVSIDT